jgi:hypothetical protein
MTSPKTTVSWGWVSMISMRIFEDDGVLGLGIDDLDKDLQRVGTSTNVADR